MIPETRARIEGFDNQLSGRPAVSEPVNEPVDEQVNEPGREPSVKQALHSKLRAQEVQQD